MRMCVVYFVTGEIHASFFKNRNYSSRMQRRHWTIMKLLLSLVALATFVAISASPQSSDSSLAQSTAYQCGENEVFQQCGVGWQCEDYCGRGQNACAYCEPGCYCRPGYKRTGPEYDATCIPENQCQQQQCSVNEVYKYCGGCEQYCNEGTASCTEDCRPGCYCQDGYKRSFRGGSCIPVSTCASPQSSDPSMAQSTGYQCGENEIFDYCGVGMGCEDYCGRGPNACDYCQSGCYCRPGYIRSGPEYDAICIPKNQCPRSQDVEPSFVENAGHECRPDEVFDICGVGPECEDYCGRCANACAYCQSACYCKQGTIRAGASNRTRCIPGNKCPVAPKCFKNEFYSDCGTACPADCENKNPVCTQNCVAGCFCKEGFIRMYADIQAKRYKCIPQDKCPPY